MNMNVGEVIKQKRLERGLSQAEVAACAGLSRPLITMLENGQVKNSNFDSIARISRVLGFSLDELARRLEGTEN